MKTTLAIISCLLLIGGCRPIICKLNHVTNPKPQSEHSVAEYLGKWDYRFPEHLFTITDSAGFYTMWSTHGINARIILFNKKGECLSDTSKGCMGKEETFVKGLQAGRDYPVEPEFGFDYYRTLMKPFGSVRLEDPSRYDFTVVVFWGIFFGNFNKDPFNIARMLMERRDLKVQTIFFNIDIQKSWGMKGNVKISII